MVRVPRNIQNYSFNKIIRPSTTFSYLRRYHKNTSGQNIKEAIENAPANATGRMKAWYSEKEKPTARNKQLVFDSKEKPVNELEGILLDVLDERKHFITGIQIIQERKDKKKYTITVECRPKTKEESSINAVIKYKI